MKIFDLDDLTKDPILSHEDEEGQSGTIIKERVKKPSLYKVLLHNDDYTTMEFVIFVLQEVFAKTTDEATGIMLSVHKTGIGVCGVYTHEIAETKAKKVAEFSKAEGHPLLCTIEPE